VRRGTYEVHDPRRWVWGFEGGLGALTVRHRVVFTFFTKRPINFRLPCVEGTAVSSEMATFVFLIQRGDIVVKFDFNYPDGEELFRQELAKQPVKHDITSVKALGVQIVETVKKWVRMRNTIKRHNRVRFERVQKLKCTARESRKRICPYDGFLD
jgi:hypothetical protein